MTWEKKSKLTSLPGPNEKGPEVTFTKKETEKDGDDTVTLLTEINISVQSRNGSLDHHVDTIRSQVASKMFVEEDKIDVVEHKLGSIPAMTVSWESGAKVKGGRHTCTLTSENDNAPIVLISTVTNFVDEESNVSKVIKAVTNSFLFLSDTGMFFFY